MPIECGEPKYLAHAPRHRAGLLRPAAGHEGKPEKLDAPGDRPARWLLAQFRQRMPLRDPDSLYKRRFQAGFKADAHDLYSR